MSNSYSSATVEAPNGGDVGGLVGDEESGLIDNCSATGQITGSTGSWAGGLVASVDAKSIIENSFATGMVSTGDAGSHSSNAGGIVGAALGAKINIENTYATGNVSGGEMLLSAD